MAVNVTFAGSTYSVPSVAGESGWASLTDYLVALSTQTATQTSLKQAIRVATSSPVTVAVTDFAVITDLATPGAVAVTLPSGVTKQIFVIVDGKGDANTNNITITPSGGQLINGAASFVLNNNRGGAIVQFDGTEWRVLSMLYTGNFLNEDIASNAGIAFSKLAALTSGYVLMGNPSNVPAAYLLDGDVAVGAGGVTSINPGVIVNADIHASAAISRSKIATASAGHVVINDPSTGAFSSEARLAGTRGGTGVSNSGTLNFGSFNLQFITSGATNLDLPTSGFLATRAGAETLTNKTLDDTSNAVLKGGNSPGTTLRMGTNDGYAVIIETDGVDRFQVNNTAALSTGDAGFLGTAGVKLPAGTTAQRPASPVAATIRLNTDTNEFEGYSAGAWQSVGGGLNEEPVKNYLKRYATGAFDPFPVGVIAATDNLDFGIDIFYASSNDALFVDTASELRGENNYVSDLSGADPAGGVFFQFPAFALDTVDLGKPVSLGFDITGLTAAGWDVVVANYSSGGTFQELIPVSGTASSATATPSAQLLTGTTRQRGFFVAGSTAGDLYAVRFRRLSGSEQVRLDTLYSGPQRELTVGANTDWQSYTPTGPWTNTTYRGRYKQIGDTGEFVVDLDFTGTPSGSLFLTFTVAQITNGLNLTLDTTKLPTSTDYSVPIGTWNGLDSGVNGGYSGIVAIDQAGNISLNYPTGTSTATSVTTGAPITWGSGDNISLRLQLPIAGWSSNTTALTAADPQYASNSNTTSTATDTTSFTYGLDGSGIPQISLGTTGVRRVRFQSPIQKTDRIEIFARTSSTGDWLPIAALGIGYARQGASEYGISWSIVNSTDVDVTFQFAGLNPSNATYAGNGAAWTAISSWQWMVVKQSGQTVGILPVSARNVVGDTSGTAVPAGMVGEAQYFTARVTTGVTAAVGVNTTPLITLPAGVWIVHARAFIAVSNTASVIYGYVALNGNTDFTGIVAEGGLGFNNVTTAANSPGVALAALQPVYAGSSGQALYAKSFSEDAAVNVDVRGFAVRIA